MPGTDTSQNVLLDEEVTTTASKSFSDINEEANTGYNTIYWSDDALFNVWFGQGGEYFHVIANVIENKLNNLKTKTSNLSQYTSDAVTSFNNNDEARNDSGIVTTNGSSGGGN